MNCLLFVAVFVAHRLCCSNGEQLLYGEGECSFSLFLFTSSVNSSPASKLTPTSLFFHSPRQCDNLSISLTYSVSFVFSALKFSFVLLSHNNFQYLSFFSFQSLFLSLCYRQNNSFTHLRMKWSRLRCWHCTRRGPGTFPRTRSKPRCREANTKATSTRAVTRIGAQSRDFQATVRPRRSLRAQGCATMWKDRKPRPEEKVGLCR